MIGIIVTVFIIMTIIAYLSFCYFVFRMMFRRVPEISLDEQDHSHTYYAPFVNILFPLMKQMRAMPYREIDITAFDGTNLKGYYLDRQSSRTIIMFHGYRSTPWNNYSYSGKWFYDKGYNILFPVLRGHGKSGGKYITFGEFEKQDFLQWIRYAEENLPCEDLLLYGVSLASHTLGILADKIPKEHVKAVILDCGYTNTYKELMYQFELRVPHFFAVIVAASVNIATKLFVGFDIHTSDTCESLKNMELPVFFIHASGDTIVPYRNTVEAYAACVSEKYFYSLDGYQHAIGFMAAGDDIKEKLSAFLNKYVKEKI